MSIPGAPSLTEDSTSEIVKVHAPQVFASFGLSEDDFKTNASFGRAYSYTSLPFHLARFNASAVVMESGVVFDPNTYEVNEKTIYQPKEREANVVRSEADDHYLVTDWWRKLAEGNSWRCFHFDGPVIVNWHRFCNIYYHFLTEFLFSVWKQMSDRDQAWRYPVVVSGDISTYQWTALRALKIDTNIVTVPANAVLRGDLLIPSALFSKTWVHPEMAAFGQHCRQVFLSGNRSAPEKIYISRARATARRLTNEKQLEASLAQAGFAIVTLEDLSFEEQVSIFGRAKIVVAPHGSGLANIIFAPAGCVVLEFTSFGFAGRWPLHDASFRRLSEVCGHTYGLLTFGNDPTSSTWTVDVNVIMAHVRAAQ